MIAGGQKFATRTRNMRLIKYRGSFIQSNGKAPGGSVYLILGVSKSCRDDILYISLGGCASSSGKMVSSASLFKNGCILVDGLVAAAAAAIHHM